MPSPSSRLLSAVALTCLSGAALAQAPQASQVTPRDLRPEAPTRPVVPAPQVAPQQAPAKADQLFVDVGAIAVDDGFAEFAAQTQPLLPPYTGHRIAVAEFYKLASAIEAIYQKAGYPLVRVAVPPQKIADGGTLHLTVLDGFLERVDARAVPASTRAKVVEAMQSLVGRRHLTSATLERALTLAGRLPGVTLRSALGAGQQTGGAVLTLEGTFSADAASVEADNRLTGSLGPWETTIQLRLNQPSLRGEQFYGYVSSGPDWSKTLIQDVAVRRVIGGGVLIPLGTDGLQLDPEYTWSDTKPRVPRGALPTESQFERFTIRLSYPLILDHSQELTLTATAEATNQSNAAPDFSYTFTQDRLRVGRLALDWSGDVPSGHLHVSAAGSQGSGGFGARTWTDVHNSYVGFSRTNMDPTFTTLALSLTLNQPLPLQFQSALTVRGQAAEGVLPSSELFSLDGEDALSTYTSGAISDDGGYSVREELARPFNLMSGDKPLALAPYVFGAFGKTTTKLPTAQTPGFSAAYGVGVRVSRDILTLSAEYGRRQARPAAMDGNQLFLKAQVQF
jgi:hemolysin activation/secretion protein